MATSGERYGVLRGMGDSGRPGGIPPRQDLVMPRGSLVIAGWVSSPDRPISGRRRQSLVWSSRRFASLPSAVNRGHIVKLVKREDGVGLDIQDPTTRESLPLVTLTERIFLSALVNDPDTAVFSIWDLVGPGDSTPGTTAEGVSSVKLRPLRDWEAGALWVALQLS